LSQTLTVANELTLILDAPRKSLILADAQARSFVAHFLWRPT
jgi:hypothetical protein